MKLKTKVKKVITNWWEDQEKWEKFCELVTGIEVIFKNTWNNSSGSIGIIEGAIIQYSPGREPMPILIVNFPNTPYKKFSLDSVVPVNKRLHRAIMELESGYGKRTVVHFANLKQS